MSIGVCSGCGETWSCANTSAKKTLLLALAERWLDLADAEGKRAKADHGSRVIERDYRRRVSEEKGE
jgi:hypothetical protein